MAERLRLDMEEEIKQFYIWKETKNIKAKEILLWHALMYLSCSAGWVKWISTPISTLESKTGLKRDAIYSARDNLERLGRIEVVPGEGSRAAQYRIIPFAENEEYTELENVLDTKEKAEETPELPANQPPTDLPGPEKPVNIFRKMQELIPMPPSMDVEQIKQFMDEGMEDNLLCEAIDITHQTDELKDRPPMEKWRYFRGIVRNWYNNGIMTLEQYQIHERDRRERIKNGSNRQNNRPAQQKPKGNGMRKFRIPE